MFLKITAMEKMKNRRKNPEGNKLIFFQVGMIIALLSVLYAFEFRSYASYDPVVYDPKIDDTPIEFIEPTKHDEPKKEPPPPPVVKIKVVDDEKVDKSKDVDIDASTNQTTPMEPWEPEIEPDEGVEDPNIIVEFPTTKPEFKGGYVAMMQFLSGELEYPLLARELNISGTVYVNFVVEKDGSITNINLLRGIGGGCDEEALRVVNLMPSWNPGLQNGRTVRVSFNLPIKFSLL